jgi:hypothetical protein
MEYDSPSALHAAAKARKYAFIAMETVKTNKKNMLQLVR